MFIWNSWSLLGLAALIVCSAMGAFVLVTRPDRSQNRRLSILLFLEGIITFASPAGAALAASPGVARGFFVTHFVTLLLVPPVMLSFLATIDTPVARPLTSRGGRILPWLFSVCAIALVVGRPALFISGLRRTWWNGWVFDNGPLTSPAYMASALGVTYSLIVAISAYRRAAQGTAAKDRAWRYAVAFGFNDVSVLIVSVFVPGFYYVIYRDIRSIEIIFVWAMPIAETVSVALMAYGILRSQLFDIDLKLAAGLRRGVLAASMLFAFLVATELAQSVVSEEFGYVIGAFAAATLLILHKPVERFAENFSRTLLPGVEASPEYIAFRKLEVYLDAVEAAYEDGQLSREDRVILSHLQAKLGVAPHDAARLEEDARQKLSRRGAEEPAPVASSN
jgi:hypothetical protein